MEHTSVRIVIIFFLVLFSLPFIITLGLLMLTKNSREAVFASETHNPESVEITKDNFKKLKSFQIFTFLTLSFLAFSITFNSYEIMNLIIKLLSPPNILLTHNYIIYAILMCLGFFFGGLFGSLLLLTIFNKYSYFRFQVRLHRYLCLGLILTLSSINSLLLLVKTDILSFVSFVNILISITFSLIICLSVFKENKEMLINIKKE